MVKKTMYDPWQSITTRNGYCCDEVILHYRRVSDVQMKKTHASSHMSCILHHRS